MRLNYKIENHTTHSGKQAVTWYCEDCHECLQGVTIFFNQSTLAKDDLDKSLRSFADAVNNSTVNTLFRKPSTAKALYNNLCLCKEGVGIVPEKRKKYLKISGNDWEFINTPDLLRHLNDNGIKFVKLALIQAMDSIIIDVSKKDVPIRYNIDETDEIKILGYTGTLSCEHIDRDTLPHGLFAYDIRHADDDESEFATLEDSVCINFAGTFITDKKIDLGEEGFRDLSSEDWEYIDDDDTNW